ncbi:MAG: recombinase family protein [Promethearchaeota archaeon]
MSTFVRIGVAASMMGVSMKTSRRRDAAGTITCYRTVGRHRRFSIIEIKRFLLGRVKVKIKGPEGTGSAAVYCRVSSHEQKVNGDLSRQVEVASTHCSEQGLGEPAVYSDVGSGLNTKRRGFDRLCKAVEQGQIGRVVVTCRDRLTPVRIWIPATVFRQPRGFNRRDTTGDGKIDA